MFLTNATIWPHLNPNRRIMLGSTQGCAQAASTQGCAQAQGCASCWAAPGDVLRLCQEMQQLQSSVTSCIGLHTRPGGSPQQHAFPVPPAKSGKM
eukprot:497179-Pelagomonas_calceolata.AAC.6